MKKKLLLIPVVALLPYTIAVLASNNAKPAFAKELQYTESALPTTINLNDCNDTEIRNYYSALNSLDASEKTGQNLLKNLKPILMNDQKYYSYDKSSGSNLIWRIYEIADRDWEKSPATALTYGTYDATTNTITNYEYGTSSSNKKNNPYIHALYVDRNVDNPKTAWDSHTPRSNPACIEREHIWPKSHGFDADEVSGARGDPMHLWAADGQSNGIHNNYFYGYVDTAKTYKNCHDAEHEWIGQNLFGFPKSFPESSAQVFEPQDCDKGDIARACFYMVARYNNIAGTDTQINSANPNLSLTNDVSKSEEIGTSTATASFSLGVLKDLLEWNKLDPVDEYELHRNNLLFRNYTNNRNPFIDFPEWADIIWGGQSGVANPQSDSLNGKTTTNVNTISIFTVADVNYGTAVAPSATAEKGGNVTFTYSTSENGTFTETVPTDAGTYYCKATSETVGEFEGTSTVKSFRIIGTKNEVVGFIVEDYKEGNVIAPKATSTNGERVKFTYSTSEDGEFTETVPTEPGTYYVKATTVGQGEYESQFAIKSFKIMEKSFIEKISDENGKVFGLFPPVVFFIICGVVVLLILIIIILILTKGKKKTKNKIKKGAKNVAKELGIPVPKTSSSSSTKKSSSSSTTKKTGTSKSSSTSKTKKEKNSK